MSVVEHVLSMCKALDSINPQCTCIYTHRFLENSTWDKVETPKDVPVIFIFPSLLKDSIGYGAKLDLILSMVNNHDKVS